MSSNSDSIIITLYPLPFVVETRVFIIMISFFLFGFIFGILAVSKTLIRKYFENFSNQRQIKKLKKQLPEEKK